MKIFDIIKYEGDNSTFIWKHPGEDFSIGSQLIVHESQEAIFFKDGQALDLFGPGKYTLETDNIPLVRKIINIPTDGKSPFPCEVYFINKVEQMAIKWGTDSKVEYIEPIYGFPIAIGASGEMSLRAVDSRRLLTNLVGSEDSLTQEKLVSYFRAFLMTRVKSYIAQIMKQQKINIFEIDEHLADFSNALHDLLAKDFEEYGLALERFFVTTVVRPDGDPKYEKAKELHFRKYADIEEAKIQQQVGVIQQETEAQRLMIESEALARKRAKEGYTYQQERGFDVAEKVAQNEAAGQFTNMGVGLGAMAGVGGAVGSMVGNALHTVTQEKQDNVYCEQCGAKIVEGARFCEDCGAPVEGENPKCTQCGYSFERPGNFCPKCGAKRL